MVNEETTTPEQTIETQPAQTTVPGDQTSEQTQTVEKEEDTLFNTKGEETEEKTEVPEEYGDFKVPEGMELDKVMLEAFVPVFKDLGLDQEKAQKLIDAYAPLVAQREEEAQKAKLKEFEDMVSGWKNETIKELGPKSKEALSFVAKVRDKFGDEEVVQLMQDTGIGNHPAMVRFLIKIGKAISEDTFPDSQTASKVNPLDVLYPSMKK